MEIRQGRQLREPYQNFLNPSGSLLEFVILKRQRVLFQSALVFDLQQVGN